ncbi:hypothetical protein [Streptomyces sp. A012304]|uniref:hypothetical protein n=1 Tax=Streptomyces sp. A012304 TaxID=375446 RepID=UPI00222E923F|nr:hypothetical protein [Streptomyces sp. A012304]GKQ37784.1 hypothetical protein ALMP_43200 [Streptomyces sp. A012304]
MGAVALLENLHCDDPRETVLEGNKDEVAITGPTGQVWPPSGAVAMGAGQDAQLNTQVPINGASIVLNLIEIDPPGLPTDALGTVRIKASEAGTGSKTVELLTEDSAYTLRYRVGNIQF